MHLSPFTPSIADLPEEIPVFPLPGAVVMPGTQLPLNVFEPRYLRMVLDVLGSHRMIGMVQPETEPQHGQAPSLYRTGTAGRITSFSETRDGRLMIVLTGVCRFDVCAELPTTLPYRRVQVDWGRFATDYAQSTDAIPNRDALFHSLRTYCDRECVDIAWKEAEGLEDQALIDLLTAHLPLAVPDKQALIECVRLGERVQLLQGLLEMSNCQAGATTRVRH